MQVTKGWSWRFRPTPGRSWRAVIPAAASSCRRADAREQQQLRRADRAGREDHLAARPHELRAAAALAQADADGPIALELHLQHLHTGPHLEVGAGHGGTKVGVGGAEAGAVLLRHLEHRGAVLLGAVVVGDQGNAGGLAGRQEPPVQRPGRALLADPQRAAGAVVLGGAADVVLGADEVGQDVAVAPARCALGLPAVVVEGAPPDVEHRVHGARPAQRLAPRHEQLAAVDVRLGLGREIPVELGVELFGEGSGDLDLQRAILASRLEQQDADGGILGQAVGQHASGRSRSDDHVVMHRATSPLLLTRPPRARAAARSGIG